MPDELDADEYMGGSHWVGGEGRRDGGTLKSRMCLHAR
jgi:hypothetical protein